MATFHVTVIICLQYYVRLFGWTRLYTMQSGLYYVIHPSCYLYQTVLIKARY